MRKQGPTLRLSMKPGRTTFLLVFGFALLAAAGCEDPPPTTYIPVPFVEGYLFVDQPIEGIVVAMTQPITGTYRHADAMVPDAEVTIEAENERHVLVYRIVDGIGSYALPDTSIRVKPETRYKLSVRLQDGRTMHAETVTPARISWTKPPVDVLQYPSDTVRLPSPDSLRIAWTAGNSSEFLVRVRCLDTLSYGRYLSPPTDEENARTNNLDKFETRESPTFYSTTRWGFIQTTSAPTVWTAFRWFGLHEVAIIAPEKYFLEWFKLTHFGGAPQYRSRFSNIRGGAGIFGAASLVKKEVFVLKRRR
ncbi:MAG: hypothetical protein QHI48_11665 [Bacteroidota bacterium]|nr:hypothetical protein [Bacteroidota bacterium]